MADSLLNIPAQQNQTGFNPSIGSPTPAIKAAVSAIGAPRPVSQFGNLSQSPTPPSSPLNQGSLVLSSYKPTASGGTAFPHPIAQATSAPVHPVQSQNDASSGGLASLLTNTYQTPNGGQVTLNGSGQVSNYTPAAGFSIDTTGSIPSNALSDAPSMQDLNNTQSSYQDLVNGVAQAQGYSPAYQQALNAQYGAQAQGAGLQFNSALLNSNLATGNDLPGDTEAYAQGATAKAQAQNTLEQAQNSIQQLSANQALNTQQLARTGQIASATTQLQDSPTGMTGANAIAQYNSLQQQYPNANIPSYNPQLSPEQNQQLAQNLVANSPAYQSQFQSTYTTPGGGTGIYSKLNLSGLQQNQDGSYTLVPAAAAALGSANAGILNTQLGNLSNINSAITSSQKTLATTQAFMNQYGLNQSGVSLLSQIQNATGQQIPDKAGAVAALKSDIDALRSDRAQYLTARDGGSIQGTNEQAAAEIPYDASPAQLAQIVNESITDGQNTASAVSQQVNQALQGISSNTNASTSGTNGGSVGSSWDNLGY